MWALIPACLAVVGILLMGDERVKLPNAQVRPKAAERERV
jgi:hypothetical protein